MFIQPEKPKVVASAPTVAIEGTTTPLSERMNIIRKRSMTMKPIAILLTHCSIVAASSSYSVYDIPAGLISHLSDLYLGSLKIFIAGGAILFIATVSSSEYCSRFTISQVSVQSALTSVFTKDSRLKIKAFFSASSCGSEGTPSSKGLVTSKPSSVPIGTESSISEVMLPA